MLLEQYIGELIVGAGMAITSWFVSRRRQRVDTKKVEIEILESALQILKKDLIQPLREELDTVRGESDKVSAALKKLQNAINKMYSCRSLPSCPIRLFLRSSEDSRQQGQRSRQPTNRQREPGRREPDETTSGAEEDG